MRSRLSGTSSCGTRRNRDRPKPPRRCGAARLATRGITTIEQLVLVGDHVAQMLLDLAKANDVDLIALVMHGRGMAPFVVGSVADKILRGSMIPLLVCRRVP